MKLIRKLKESGVKIFNALSQVEAHHNPEKIITPGMPELLRSVAAQTAVLLENRVLPLNANTKVSVFVSIFEANSYPKYLSKHLTTRSILTIPQAVTPHIHQITALAFDEFPSSSVFAFIKATLLSILFFIEARTTNPIIMKSIVIQSNRSTFTPPLYN